ncbi:class I SAM-dependent methyltransferase [Streptomyces gobitricini]|uniref:SAM-dependent methyltransferase Erg6/SMT-type domain-containing protein n=1 Tax=Streptomyces gobitricini TaxID=68211 RepID=A0ABP6A7H9_9ACTN
METVTDTRAYEELAGDPKERRRLYTTLVREYYAFSTELYRAAWGQSHHFPPFMGGESRAEAMAAAERSIADRGGFGPGTAVLEVGSGVGGPAVTIAAHSGAHVTGLDLVEHRVEYAREHAAAQGMSHLTDFRTGDATHMPFPDGSFDAVYSIQAICHAPDKARVHAEAARVLKPGGVYLGSDWFQADGLTPEQQERHVEPVCQGLALPVLSSPAALGADLAAAGLVVEDLHDLGEDGDLEPNWREMEELMAAVPREDMTPLLAFMERAGTALCEAARAGAFVICCWTARKPS